MQFSVLMSVYKNDDKNAFADAMDSVLNQSISPDQVVLVVDGPVPDELNETIRNYELSRPDVLDIVRLKDNVGLGRALAEGLFRCRNEIVARMDSDDISLPDRFEKQIAFFRSHPETDVLGGQIAEYDSEMKHMQTIRKVPLCMSGISRMMKARNGMNHVSVMYRKSSVLKAGNYQHCPYFEDYYLWCRMITSGMMFHNLEDVLVNVRVGDGMFRRRGGKEYNRAIIRFEKDILKIGFINRIRCYFNIAARLCVANVPNGFRSTVYGLLLRSRS